MMGLFAITEVFNQSLELDKPRPKIEFKKTTLIPPLREMKSCWKAIGIGCVIGTGIGILPGIGQNASTLISYNLARPGSKSLKNSPTAARRASAPPRLPTTPPTAAR